MENSVLYAVRDYMDGIWNGDDVQEDYFAESLALDGSGSYLPGGVSPQPVSTGKRVLTGLLSLPIRLFRYLV